MLFLAGMCGFDNMLSGMGSVSHPYGDWVGAAGTLTFVAIIVGLSTLRAARAVRLTLFCIWFLGAWSLTLYAVSISDVYASSTTPISDTVVAWSQHYAMLTVPGLLFGGTAASFAWMLSAGYSRKEVWGTRIVNTPGATRPDQGASIPMTLSEWDGGFPDSGAR
jgi:hypothetical protein